VATQYERRINEVTGTLGSLRKKHKELEQRRALDLEGFTAGAYTRSHFSAI